MDMTISTKVFFGKENKTMKDRLFEVPSESKVFSTLKGA